MKFKLLKRFIAIFIAIICIFSLIKINMQSADAENATHPQAEITITSNPAHMTAEGDVTVTVNVTNTNPVNDTASTIDSTDPLETDTPAPTPTPMPTIGTYLNVNISNSYGAKFVQQNVEPGVTATFTATMHVTATMIGTPLTFTVEWQEFNGTYYPSYSQQVQLTIGRANTVYLSLTRIMSKTSAANGEKVTISYVLVNTGTVTLTDIRLYDEKIAGTSPLASNISLKSGESYQCDYTYTMGSESVVSKPVAYFRYSGSNTEYSVTASKQTLGLMNAQLSKEVIVGSSTAEGVDITLYLTNNGNCTLSNLVVTDDLGKVIASKFSLDIGETKIIEYYAENPEYVRYVVFTISGKNDTTSFVDKTASVAVRPYINPDELGIDFSVEILDYKNENSTIVLQFSLMNTGSIDYHNVSIMEKNLNLQVCTPYEILRPSSQPKLIPFEITLEEETDLIFELTATDTSGNSYSYQINLRAGGETSVLPSGQTPQPANPTVVEDLELGHKLDNLLTNIGKELTSIYKVLGIVAIVIGIALIALAIIEVVMRVKMKRATSGVKGE